MLLLLFLKNHTATLHSRTKPQLRCLQRLAVLDCKDTKKNVLKQDFSEKIWNYQKKYLSLQRQNVCFGYPVSFRVGARLNRHYSSFIKESL